MFACYFSFDQTACWKMNTHCSLEENVLRSIETTFIKNPKLQCRIRIYPRWIMKRKILKTFPGRCKISVFFLLFHLDFLWFWNMFPVVREQAERKIFREVENVRVSRRDLFFWCLNGISWWNISFLFFSFKFPSILYCVSSGGNRLRGKISEKYEIFILWVVITRIYLGRNSGD